MPTSTTAPRTTAPRTTAPRTTAPRTTAWGVLAIAFTAIAAILGAPVASAHGDDGTLALVSATGTGTSAVVTVRLTYDNDAEPVETATVTVAGDNGAGATLDPVPMSPGPEAGQFTATVQFPSAGTWNLRVTSVTPAATLAVTHEVAADPGVSVTTSPDGTADGADPDSTASSVPADDGPPVISPAPTEGEDESSSSSPWLWVLGGVAVVVCVGLGVVFVRRGRDQGPID